jgi:pimeloyl-ACP methyl ester carboxylesterase
MTTFVLVHGGFHGAWCWERVVGPLAEHHAVVAVALPGRGGTGRPELADYLDTVAEAVDRAEPPVVLVGHSLGGVIVSQFVEHRPDAVAGLVLANALLVEDGEAAMPKMQSIGEDWFFARPGALTMAEDGSTFWVAPELLIEGFYNCCQPADAEWAAAQLCPEPLGLVTAPLRISSEGFGSVPKVYLGGSRDRVLPWWFQQKMSAAAGARLVDLGGDHSPFLSVPDKLVDHLLEIGSKGLPRTTRARLSGSEASPTRSIETTVESLFD